MSRNQIALSEAMDSVNELVKELEFDPENKELQKQILMTSNRISVLAYKVIVKMMVRGGTAQDEAEQALEDHADFDMDTIQEFIKMILTPESA